MIKYKFPISFSSNSSGIQSESIDAIRSELANAGLVSSSVVAFFLVGASLIRAMAVGWQDIMFLHVAIFLVALWLIIFHRRFNYKTRALLVPGFLFLGGVAGLYRLGLVGMAIPTLITCCILITIFFGSRFGFGVLAVNMGVIALIGALVKLGHISFRFDIHAYAVNPFSWIVAALGSFYFMGLIVATLGRLHNSLVESIGALNRRTSELQQINEQLKSEIVERERAKKSLKQSEERYRLLVDNSSNSIHLFDGNGRILLINAASANVLGRTPEDLSGKSLYEIFPSEIANLYVERHRKVMNTGNGDNFEDLVELPTGKKWFLSNIQPVRDEAGNIFAVQAISYDITERKQAEDEVRRLRNLLRNIFDSMPSILVGVDKEEKVTEWNREAEKATAITAENARGCLLTSVFPQMAGEMEKLRQAISEGRSLKNEKVPNEREGETYFSDVTIYPLESNGIEGAVIRIDDVTDRVRIEEMMIQSEKMLSVGGLAAGMAHEINNPLAGILQNVQVLDNRMSVDIPKNREVAEKYGTTVENIQGYMEERGMFELIDSIMESGKRAAKIVENMLSFSRKDDARFAPYDLEELLDKTIELAEKDYDLKKKYDFRHVEIVREYDSSLPPVICEGSKIQQVFLNILKNGAYAMSEEGGKTEPSRFILRTYKDDNLARIEIEDNGPGMDEATRKRVFEPFFTTKSAGVGTGLGLSVSYFIITENHGGTISVESAPGKGSKFIIRLPLKRISD